MKLELGFHIRQLGARIMITIIWYVSTIERKSETYVMSLPQPYYLKLSDLLQIIDVTLPNTEFTQWYVNIIKTISRFKIYEILYIVAVYE